MKEYILCAAIHYLDGNVWLHQPKNVENGFVICGRRHHNCFMTRKILVGEHAEHVDNIQGFVTSKDRFLNRKEAYALAIENGQLKEETSEVKALVSEDLW
jgi:hypothetical protein